MSPATTWKLIVTARQQLAPNNLFKRTEEKGVLSVLDLNDSKHDQFNTKWRSGPIKTYLDRSVDTSLSILGELSCKLRHRNARILSQLHYRTPSLGHNPDMPLLSEESRLLQMKRTLVKMCQPSCSVRKPVCL